MIVARKYVVILRKLGYGKNHFIGPTMIALGNLIRRTSTHLGNAVEFDSLKFPEEANLDRV